MPAATIDPVIEIAWSAVPESIPDARHWLIDLGGGQPDRVQRTRDVP